MARTLEDTCKECMHTMKSFVDRTDDAFESMIQFKDETARQLTKIEAMETALDMIAVNTKGVHETLVGLREDNKELVSIATGRKQVPTTIFLLVVGVMVVWILLDKIGDNPGEFSLSPTSIHFTPLHNGTTTRTDK